MSVQQIAENHASRQAIEPMPEVKQKPDALTKENLSMHDAISQKGSNAKPKKKGAKKSEKPAWAVTEKQQEDAKEKEIDELLEFAYELDYEKYMEDYEVRQALAIIKDRVAEITNEEGWKEKLVQEWNAAA